MPRTRKNAFQHVEQMKLREPPPKPVKEEPPEEKEDPEAACRREIKEIKKQIMALIDRKHLSNKFLLEAQRTMDENGLTFGSFVSGPVREKLHRQYSDAQEALEEEELVLRGYLDQITAAYDKYYNAKRATHLKRGELMALLAQKAHFIPLWVGRPDQFPPALVGAIPAPVGMNLKLGWEVAANVSDTWILAEIVSVKKDIYEIKDVDEKGITFDLHRRHLVPLPHYRADPVRDRHALFPEDAIVLALYPQTTCFYEGIVKHTPESEMDPYLVAFKDDFYDYGYSPELPVPQRYVVTLRQRAAPKCKRNQRKGKK